jgi:hypothetical protein
MSGKPIKQPRNRDAAWLEVTKQLDRRHCPADKAAREFIGLTSHFAMSSSTRARADE